MAEQQIIGEYFVKANDNKMKLVFNDQVKDSKGANGKSVLMQYSIQI